MGEHDPFNSPEYNASVIDNKRKRNFHTFRLETPHSTVESFLHNMLTVPAVTNVELFENHTNETDEEGRPPHSIHLIVTGGNAREIARKIFDIKPAGIATFGQVLIPVIEVIGICDIQFDRPYKLSIYERLYFYLYGKCVRLFGKIRYLTN